MSRNGYLPESGRTPRAGRWWDRLLNPFPSSSLGVVRSQQDFQAELEREMLRAERYNTILTLMLIDAVGVKLSRHDYREAMQCLGPIAASVTRKIDVLGYFCDERGTRLGLILPHTQPTETDRTIQEITQRFREVMWVRNGMTPGRIEPAFEIYGYPVDGRLTETEDDRQLLLFDDEFLLSDKNGTASVIGAMLGAESERPFRRGISYPVLARLRDPNRSAVPLWKRAMDVSLTLLLLLVFSPLLMAIAIAVKLTSPGPVFYKQNRVGLGGRVFKMWKFRSMRADDKANVIAHKEYLKQLLNRSANAFGEKQEKPMEKLGALDNRITPIGKLLRVTSMDELPQLFNVLMGEMSLVGPRPSMPYETESFQSWCNRRFDVLPGLTGAWQVNGKNRTTFKQMVRMDIEYAQRQSFWWDLRIMVKTVPVILKDVRDAIQKRWKRESKHVAQKA